MPLNYSGGLPPNISLLQNVIPYLDARYNGWSPGITVSPNGGPGGDGGDFGPNTVGTTTNGCYEANAFGVQLGGSLIYLLGGVTWASGVAISSLNTVITAGSSGGITGTNLPFVTVSPIGLSTSGVVLPNNGANYGPDTSGTTTSGIQEACNSGKAVFINGGTYTYTGTVFVTSNIAIISDGAILKASTGQLALLWFGTSSSQYTNTARLFGTLVLDGNRIAQSGGLSGGNWLLNINGGTNGIFIAERIEIQNVYSGCYSISGLTTCDIQTLSLTHFNQGNGEQATCLFQDVSYTHITHFLAQNCDTQLTTADIIDFKASFLTTFTCNVVIEQIDGINLYYGGINWIGVSVHVGYAYFNSVAGDVMGFYLGGTPNNNNNQCTNVDFGNILTVNCGVAVTGGSTVELSTYSEPINNFTMGSYTSVGSYASNRLWLAGFNNATIGTLAIINPNVTLNLGYVLQGSNISVGTVNIQGGTYSTGGACVVLSTWGSNNGSGYSVGNYLRNGVTFGTGAADFSFAAGNINTHGSNYRVYNSNVYPTYTLYIPSGSTVTDYIVNSPSTLSHTTPGPISIGTVPTLITNFPIPKIASGTNALFKVEVNISASGVATLNSLTANYYDGGIQQTVSQVLANGVIFQKNTGATYEALCNCVYSIPPNYIGVSGVSSVNNQLYASAAVLAR